MDKKVHRLNEQWTIVHNQKVHIGNNSVVGHR